MDGVLARVGRGLTQWQVGTGLRCCDPRPDARIRQRAGVGALLGGGVEDLETKERRSDSRKDGTNERPIG